MNNTMMISDGLKKNSIKDYENKLFKMYDKVVDSKKKLFDDKEFQIVLFKQRYDINNKRWVMDNDEEFNNISLGDEYKSIVTIALYKNGKNYVVNGKKIMNSYYVVDISKRKQMNNKWLVKYFVLNNDIYKDLEYYYVLTSVA